MAIGRRYHRSVTVTASVGGFVPKPQTPFQWFGQNTIEELPRKVGLIRDAARPVRGLTCAGTTRRPPPSRGSPAVATAAWGRSSSTCGAPGEPSRSGPSTSTSACGPTALAARAWTPGGCRVPPPATEDEALPWDHISAGLHRDFLWQDFEEALAEHGLRGLPVDPCYDCGACTGLGVEHMVASAVPPAGGSQGTGQDLSTGGQVPVRFLDGAVRRRSGRPAGRKAPVGAAEGRG